MRNLLTMLPLLLASAIVRAEAPAAGGTLQTQKSRPRRMRGRLFTNGRTACADLEQDFLHLHVRQVRPLDAEVIDTRA